VAGTHGDKSAKPLPPATKKGSAEVFFRRRNFKSRFPEPNEKNWVRFFEYQVDWEKWVRLCE
jgi:hypothetical protein